MDIWIALATFIVVGTLSILLVRDIHRSKYLARSSKIIPAVISIAILAGGIIVTYDILTVGVDTHTIATSGIIPQEVGNVNIEVYSDSFGHYLITEVDWGNLSPGDIVEQDVYVRNTGGDDVIVTISTQDWNFTPVEGQTVPSNPEDYFDVTWSFSTLPLGVNRQRLATITLTLSSIVYDIDYFEFDIVITGTEV
jgi:hypothetical protein